MHHYPKTDDTTEDNSYLFLWDIDPSVTEIPHGTASDWSWYIGANKDGNATSYTSPCSPSAKEHEYTITLYALSETPSSLLSSVDVDYDTIMEAIDTVTIIDKTELSFLDVNQSDSATDSESDNNTPTDAPEDEQRKYCGNGIFINTESSEECSEDCSE